MCLIKTKLGTFYKIYLLYFHCRLIKRAILTDFQKRHILGTSKIVCSVYRQFVPFLIFAYFFTVVFQVVSNCFRWYDMVIIFLYFFERAVCHKKERDMGYSMSRLLRFSYDSFVI